MKSSAAKCLLYGSVVLLLLLFIQANAYATAVSFSVNVDTTSLVGTYEAGFVLLDASGLGDANNTVTIDDFAYGGGSAGAVDPTFTIGGATGDLSSGIDLVDSSPASMESQASSRRGVRFRSS